MLFSNVFSSACATTTVFFLFFYKKIDSFYFSNYILSLFAFYSSFFLFAKKIGKNNFINASNFKNNKFYEARISNLFFLLFFIFSSIHILLQLFIYYKTGIPLFMKSRLEVNIHGGALIGLLSRCMPLFSIPASLGVFYILFFSCKGRQRLYSKIYFLICLLFSFLSGSKSGFLVYIFNFSTFVYFTQKYCKKGYKILINRKMFYLLIVCTIVTFFIMYIQIKGNLIALIQHLFLRFAAYGDTYIYLYQDEVFSKLSKNSLFELLTDDFFYTFRLKSDLRPTGFGFELMDTVYNISGSAVGPNPRFNAVGLVNFGYIGCIFFSFFCGMIFTYVRNKFVDAVDYKFSRQVLVFYIYSLFSICETDVAELIVRLTTNAFLQIIIATVILFFILYLAPKNNTKYKKE